MKRHRKSEMQAVYFERFFHRAGLVVGGKFDDFDSEYRLSVSLLHCPGSALSGIRDFGE